MTLAKAIDEFLLACSADGLREKTLIWYESLLKKFRLQVNLRDLAAITTTHLRAYLVSLRVAGYSEDTVHGHTRALHRFFKWCSLEYDIPNPMRNIAYPKQPTPKLPKAVAPGDVIKLLATCDNSPLGIRDKAIIAFLTDTGCRAGELVTLTRTALDMDLMSAYVIGKGGGTRPVMFTETTAVLLYRWLRIRNERQAKLFHGLRIGDHQDLSANGLGQMLERRRKRAGICRANPHSFRHGFAVAYILDGGDLATLSRILGHEDITTTGRFYAKFVQDELRQMHSAHTPMRKVKAGLESWRTVAAQIPDNRAIEVAVRKPPKTGFRGEQNRPFNDGLTAEIPQSRSCPACGATERQIKIGKNPSGSQRFKCQMCGKKYTPKG